MTGTAGVATGGGWAYGLYGKAESYLGYGLYGERGYYGLYAEGTDPTGTSIGV